MSEIIINSNTIHQKIIMLRGVQVMIDSDLAELYVVETKNLNRAVSRNIDRFPDHFRFQLTAEEYSEYERTLRFQNGTLNGDGSLRSQLVTLNEVDPLRSQIATLETGRGRHRKYLPYAFTEQGVSMLSAVLNSETAIRVSIQIIDTFVEMRRFIAKSYTYE
jgi:hypothetical protein